LVPHARAQAVAKASAFLQQVGNNMAAIVNGGQSAAQKRQALTQIVDSNVDVAEIARFCLGRFWRTATPDQQTRYLAAFHDFLVMSISSRLGEYRGVKLSVLREREQDGTAIVTSTIERPNNQPATVDWVIEQPATAPKIVDVVAEGTSMRLTQRQDYASYLSQNSNNIDALIKAMIQQTSRNG
jgi:phospholipid transport system substrate-binding protein